MIFNISGKGNENQFIYKEEDELLTVSIQPRFYPTVDAVVEAIDAQLRTNFQCGHVNFSFNKILQRCFMNFKKNSKYAVSLGSDIAHILGFLKDTPYFCCR